ncbi:exported protein of unknown function [Candidatus Nitrosotalea okcheonensis]|uniref:HNH nuclease domain-containing protein n=1 Tax=Candidatus Nitrosotalea okcheonensis TaxID=1903276 RepID=A0A2H1FCH5_9ARCH|nr:exported protein of unknown function [Candidatus Nitrosotalea okcheonensis]
MLRIFIILLIVFVLLPVTFDSEAWSLTQESQKILNNYHNFEQTGSPPATSQPYSPNNSPPEINAVPAPKTNVIPPATSQPSYSPSPNVQNNSPSSSNSPPNIPFIWVGIVLMFVVFVLVKIFRRGGTTHQTTGEYTTSREPVPRRNFSKEVQHQTLMRQGGKCAICREFSKTWDADHKNGNRSDDSPYNCQMLCPNCHTYKSRKNQMGLD